MKPTRQHRRETRLLWQAILVHGQPDADRLREAIQAVCRKTGHAAEAILRCFAQRLEIYLRSQQVTLVSAEPLSASQQERLSALFENRTGIRFCTDPTIIGGLRIERGYEVTDRTLARQFDVLRNLLCG